MDSVTFVPGQAHLASACPVAGLPWMLVFEDEGPAGYCYVLDRSVGQGEEGIVDSMLIYNGAALEERSRQRLAGIQWSRDGQRAALYLDGTAQAFADFSARESFCRSNFPNFMDAGGARWRGSSHAWNEAAVQSFEAELYAVE